MNTFYGRNHKESTMILRKCGFNVTCANWDAEPDGGEMQPAAPRDQKADCPSATCSVVWRKMTFGSGTKIVDREPQQCGMPHYHIGHAAADGEGDQLRDQIGKELERWLNGGEEPWWMDLLHRESPDSVKTPHGSSIRATGPMVDRAEPPSWGDWWEDDCADAQIARGLMADALMNKVRIH